MLDLQVVAFLPTQFFHCRHCEPFFQQAGIGEQVHHSELEQYPADFIRNAAKLTDWLLELVRSYGSQIRIRVIDPQSPKGFLLSLRHWVRSYPAFILEGRKAYIGWDREVLDQVLQKCLL